MTDQFGVQLSKLTNKQLVSLIEETDQEKTEEMVFFGNSKGMARRRLKRLYDKQTNEVHLLIVLSRMAQKTQAGMELINRASLFNMSVTSYLQSYGGDVIHAAPKYDVCHEHITGESDTHLCDYYVPPRPRETQSSQGLFHIYNRSYDLNHQPITGAVVNKTNDNNKTYGYNTVRKEILSSKKLHHPKNTSINANARSHPFNNLLRGRIERRNNVAHTINHSNSFDLSITSEISPRQGEGCSPHPVEKNHYHRPPSPSTNHQTSQGVRSEKNVKFARQVVPEKHLYETFEDWMKSFYSYAEGRERLNTILDKLAASMRLTNRTRAFVLQQVTSASPIFDLESIDDEHLKNIITDINKRIVRKRGNRGGKRLKERKERPPIGQLSSSKRRKIRKRTTIKKRNQ